MIANILAFFWSEEQDTNKQLELGDDGKSPTSGLDFISFCMPIRKVVEFHAWVIILLVKVPIVDS